MFPTCQQASTSTFMDASFSFTFDLVDSATMPLVSEGQKTTATPSSSSDADTKASTPSDNTLVPTEESTPTMAESPLTKFEGIDSEVPQPVKQARLTRLSRNLSAARDTKSDFLSCATRKSTSKNKTNSASSSC
ncbi:hypothetical protein BT96DRAFT_1000829 [Gymnopus androsaceus JB14]|uniref:Uncharacterized protein n=1 Tax=Gymnopus androsaceus JB14 TaxID=1447944 RepID=A0A6A4H164_9AGAR|nr:hypothetical protein BT96DRAFT_1000829 [Gymnopus androsaceus JB14]